MPAYGPAGVYTFVLDIEEDGRVTYQWGTDVIKARDGSDAQRISLRDAPQEFYEFSATVDDESMRVILAALIENAADAPVFRVALPYEALPLVADSDDETVFVPDVEMDWLVAGQRVAILSPDDEVFESFIVSAASGEIELDAAPGSVGIAGGTIMPTVAVHLQPQTGYASYQVNEHTLQIRAIAIEPGYAGEIEMGVGATVDTFDGLPVWDHGLAIESTVTSSVESRTEIVNLGGAIAAVSAASVSELGRQLRMSGDPDFQWFKRFMQTVLGRQKAFLLPTERPDLVYVTHAGVNLTVTDSAQYVEAWFPSLAHRRLALVKTDGTVQYVTVESAGDNGNGTQTLELGAAITGTVETISFLEQCRLEGDAIGVTWTTAKFTTDMKARVVQAGDDGALATWKEYETSIQHSKPIELYVFETPSTTYRLTSHYADVDFGGDTYTASPNTRSNALAPTTSDSSDDFTVEMLASESVAQFYADGIAPGEMRCTVMRYQAAAGVALEIGSGYVSGLTFKGRLAGFRVPTASDELAAPCPTLSVGPFCANMLFDDRCTVDPDGFKVSTTIATISTDRKTITVASMGAHPDGWARLGKIVHPATTERRVIVEHTGTTLVLKHKLPLTISETDAIDVFAGCDKLIATCFEKFVNTKNFFGAPQLPTVNPFYWDKRNA